MRQWNGFYYDGRTAERQAVEITVEDAGLRLQRAAAEPIFWPFTGVRQTQGSLSSEQVRLEFGTEFAEALLVDEPGFAAEIRRLAPAARRVLRRQHSTSRIAAWSLGAIGFLAVSYIWGAPVAATWLAPRVPLAWEASMGRGAFEQLAPPDRRCGDATTVPELRTVLDRLVAAGPRGQYSFRMVVVRDTVINAFAAPGGFIVVNSGLLAATRTPEELAGVLAHEIQHVTHRHSTRAIIREMPLRIAISAVAGGSGTEAAASMIGALGTLRYRRGDEAEADRDGMRLIQAAEIDPQGMVAFMQRLERQGTDAPRLVNYLSSHPRTADRVAGLESLAARRHYEPRPLLDAAAWDRLRALCDE